MVETGFTLCDYDAAAGSTGAASRCERRAHCSQYETQMFS